MHILVDSGLTRNYINTREYAARGIKVEVEDCAEELKMGDGAMVKIEG